MNVFEFVNNRGLKEVPNPLYNPRSKKNNQPATILVPDIDETNDDFGLKIANRSLDEQQSILSSEVEKYNKHGITWSPYNTNIDAELADVQSNWTKAGNSLAQTIVSEFGLGTIKAFTDIGGAIFEAFNEIIGNEQRDYQNSISDKLQEWQDTFNEEIAPIHMKPGVDIQNGGFSDFAWYAKNFPQLASTLTLLIPTMAVGKAASAIAKVTNAGSKFRKARLWATRAKKLSDNQHIRKLQLVANNPLNVRIANEGAKTFGDAMIMRTIENYQEARDTHIQTYQTASEKLNAMDDTDYSMWLAANKSLIDEAKEKGVNISDKDAISKYIATKAADRTFAMDFSNIVFDIVQLASLRNYGKKIKPKGREIDAAQKESIESTEEFAKGLKSKNERLGRSNGQEPTKTESTTNTKPTTEVKPEVKRKFPIIKNTFDVTKDFVKYNAKTIAAQSTESIEEAVNYIAQQEGITYGKALIAGDNSYDGNRITGLVKSWTNLQNPIEDYLKTAELQESAFWGLLGGMTFGYIGDASYRVKNYIDNKAEFIENQVDPITGKKLEKPSWVELFELPTIKAAKAAMRKRQNLIAQYQSRYDLIESGKNIYGKTDEKGNYLDFDGDIALQQEIAKSRLENEFIQELGLDAAYTGTLDLTKEFMKSDAVKQTMIKIGLAEESNIDAYVENIVNKIEKVNELYNEQSVFVLGQLGELNADKEFDYDVPYEYAAIIARDNVTNLLTIDDIDGDIAVYNNNVAEQLATLKKLGNNVDENKVRQYIKLGNLINAVGRLRAQEEQLKNTKAETVIEQVQKAKTLKEIESQKQKLYKELKIATINNETVGLQNIFNSLKYSISYLKDKDKHVKTDAEILKEAKDIFKAIEGSTEIVGSDESIIQDANAIFQSLINNINKEEFKRNNRKLFNDIATSEELELQKKIYQSRLISNYNDIKERIDYYNVTMNEARKKAVSDAEEIVRKTILQYDGITTDTGLSISEAIIAAYNGDKTKARQLAEEYMTNVPNKGTITADEFIDAIDVLTYSNYTKGMMLDWVTNTIEMEKQKQAQSRRSSDDTSGTTSDSDGNVNQKNTTNQNSISEEQNNQKEKSISQPLETQQNQAGQTTKADNRPINKVKLLINNIGKIRRITHAPNSNNTLPVYDNGDGTFELDLTSLSPSEQSKFAIQNSYLTVDDDINIIDPNDKWEVVENPTLRREGKEYVLVRPGRISKVEETTTITSPVEETQQDVQQEPIVEPIVKPSEEVNITNNEEEQIEETKESTTDESDVIPSTGEGVESNISESYDDATVIQLEAFEVIRNNFPNAYSDPNLNIDDIIAAITNELNSKADANGWSQEIINKIINDTKLSIIQARDFVLNQKTPFAQKGAEMAMASRIEEYNADDFSDFFVKPAEEFLNEYNKVLIVKEFNGKKVIRIGDILRICNSFTSSNDTTLARSLYNVITAYLTSPIGQAKYHVPDLHIGEKLIDQSIKSIEELQDEAFGSEESFRVNIEDFINNAKLSLPEQQQKYFEILNSLQVGDKLTLFAVDDELILSKNGVTIGNMPKPTVRGKGYVVANEGWVTDVELDANGNIISKAKDTIIGLFTGSTDAHDNLRELLVKNENNVNKEIPNSLLEQFKNNPLIVKLIEESKKNAANKTNLLFVDYKTGEIKVDLIFKHLTKLWNYSTLGSSASNAQLRNNRVKTSLNKWFKKLYNTYDTVTNTTDNIDVSVTKITEGELIRVQDNTNADNAENLPLVQDAISDLDNAKIAMVDSNDVNVVNISGREPYNVKRFTANSTLILVPSRNSEPSFAKIWGIKYNAENLSSNANLKRISNAIYNGFYTKVRQLGENGKLGNIKELEDFISSIINVRSLSGKIPLFRTFASQSMFTLEDNVNPNTGEKTGINIVYSEKGKVVERFRINNRDLYGFKLGYQVHGNPFVFAKNNDNVEISKTIALEFFNFISKYTNFNISSEGIKSDNKTTESFNGFITKKDGKLILDIPINETSFLHEEYDSYNDFVIKNNLIKVNTKKNKNGSNFERFGDNQLNNQTLFVSLPTRKSTASNVDSTNSIDNNLMEDDAISEDYQFIKTITEENKESAGKNIVEHVLGEEFVKAMNEISEEFDITENILPTRIMIDSELNHMKNNKLVGSLAYSSVFGTRPKYSVYRNGKLIQKRIPANERTIIGPLLLSMLSSSNIERRKRGVRTLIHERLHEIINSDKNARIKLLYELNNVYKIYESNLEKDLNTFDKNSNEYKVLKTLKDKLSKYKQNETILLEEFLVETLTDSNMANYLNSIEVGVANNNKPETLLSRIMRALAKLFGWGIKEGSLYMQQLNILRDALTENVQETNSETSNISNENVVENQETEQQNNQEEEKHLNEETVLNDEDVSEEEEIVLSYDVDEDVSEEDITLSYIEDDIALESSIEEYSSQNNLFDTITTLNVDGFKKQLPVDLQAKFSQMETDGVIETKCR